MESQKSFYGGMSKKLLKGMVENEMYDINNRYPHYIKKPMKIDKEV